MYLGPHQPRIGVTAQRRASSPSGAGGAMVQRAATRALSLLGVALLVHFIAVTSVAEKEGGVVLRRDERSILKSHKGSAGNHLEEGDADENGKKGTIPSASPSPSIPTTPAPAAAIFGTQNSTVVTAQTGSSATLPCVVRKFGNGVVSWVRRKDFHLLTVGLTTYSSDDRFLVVHTRHLQVSPKGELSEPEGHEQDYISLEYPEPGSGHEELDELLWGPRRHSKTTGGSAGGAGGGSSRGGRPQQHSSSSASSAFQNWGLQIKFVQPRDAGMYECQVSSHPPTSIFVELKVVEARAEIIGAPDLHLKSGSTLRLSCVLRQSTEPPVYVFWYHDDRMINYDRERGVSVEAERSGSALVVREARRVDSGNYTCVPSNARPASVNVHVLNGEKPAAMQHGSRSGSAPGRGLAPSAALLAAMVAFPAAAWIILPIANAVRAAKVPGEENACPGLDDSGGGRGREGWSHGRGEKVYPGRRVGRLTSDHRGGRFGGPRGRRRRKRRGRTHV